MRLQEAVGCKRKRSLGDEFLLNAKDEHYNLFPSTCQHAIHVFCEMRSPSNATRILRVSCLVQPTCGQLVATRTRRHKPRMTIEGWPINWQSRVADRPNSRILISFRYFGLAISASLEKIKFMWHRTRGILFPREYFLVKIISNHF